MGSVVFVDVPLPFVVADFCWPPFSIANNSKTCSLGMVRMIVVVHGSCSPPKTYGCNIIFSISHAPPAPLILSLSLFLSSLSPSWLARAAGFRHPLPPPGSFSLPPHRHCTQPLSSHPLPQSPFPQPSLLSLHPAFGAGFPRSFYMPLVQAAWRI